MTAKKKDDSASTNNQNKEIEAVENAEEPAPELLQQAFDVFAKASQQLEASYEELKVRADRLAKELAQTNEELQKQLTEKERISNFLSNILQSIRNGIVVISHEGEVVLTNQLAHDMVNYDGDPQGVHYRKLFGKGQVAGFLDSCFDDPEHRPRSTEQELNFGDSGGRKIYALTFAPVLARTRKQVAFLLIMQDVTRLKLLEEQALRTNRLAAMGEVAAQLAHEIRNPLGSIEIFASLLSRDLKNDPNQKLADNIVVGVKSLNSVVTNMLTFTRTITINPEPIEINELVSETIGFLEQILKVQSIRIDMKLSKKAGKAEVDPELIKQVILNLAQNSIYAMENRDEGILCVKTKPVRTDDGLSAVEICIEDNGIGIGQEDLPRIFDPFFSTRTRGTGLGLSVVSQIIEKHGGLITAESKLDVGTTMRFSVPVKSIE